MEKKKILEIVKKKCNRNSTKKNIPVGQNMILVIFFLKLVKLGEVNTIHSCTFGLLPNWL